ncbi:PocR ligand-binding domain-containing protein [Enterococcus hermanniensis]|uniref:AraC family transcriptional regulator n=1 Tax=Enterococcus hermanniensis TaxID=249189 RepID=A0A1L8TS91_9ENTE|nr:PocR ligand-binding domain-containing protein [Enterococcus hermanniensis]OJG47022.1 AraC family transcriptional regulator [Enterococcus hermanniensis]
MNNAQFDIERVLDLNKWESVQESLAIATHLAIILVDYRGRPVTKHSQIQPFCQLARRSPELSVHCEKCDSRGGLEAVRSGQPFIYRCHFDIVDMAIPIMFDNRYVGAIMAGEILLEEGQEELEQVLKLDDQQFVNNFKRENQQFIDQYPRFSKDDLANTAMMLEKISEYIISEAIKKDYLINAYKQTLRVSKREEQINEDSLDLEFVQKDIQHSKLQKRLVESKGVYVAKNQVLQPAVDLVFENKENHVDLTTLADVTNLSTSHLSRLLKEEFGEPFSKIYGKLKVYWAEQLLKSTDWSITEISAALGYIEPGYFIRMFKKITGVTPLNYRKIY